MNQVCANDALFDKLRQQYYRNAMMFFVANPPNDAAFSRLMPDEKFPLIVRSGESLRVAGTHSGRIVAEMVGVTLELSLSTPDVTARFRIGDYEFCEPDYQQILQWARALKIKPKTVIKRLLTAPEVKTDQKYQTHFTKGQIVNLRLNMGLLPLKSIEWVDGLVIESVDFIVPHNYKRSVLDLPLPLPKLQVLKCSNMRLLQLKLRSAPLLTKILCGWNSLDMLDLSSIPLLTELNCSENHLTKLDLSAIKLLSKLECGWNQIRELDLSAVPLLTDLGCWANRINELDLYGVPLLTKLDCAGNRLNYLDLTPVPLLTELNYSGNPSLAELDFSAVPLLTKLESSDNELTELDLSAVP
ncbi:MAG: hypothetical protein WCN98_08300, partial [Verrucomicrobiaceae bacterium]